MTKQTTATISRKKGWHILTHGRALPKAEAGPVRRRLSAMRSCTAFSLQVFWQQVKSSNMEWISIAERLPKNRQKVIAGHCLGQWVIDDVLFVAEDHSFRLRVNAATGGDAGYKQKDTKKPNGDPAGPNEWLWGAQAFPTHWMPLPEAPSGN